MNIREYEFSYDFVVSITRTNSADLEIDFDASKNKIFFEHWEEKGGIHRHCITFDDFEKIIECYNKKRSEIKQREKEL